MRVDIGDFFDCFTDEEGAKMKITTEDIDMEKIRSMTMNRIRADGARRRKTRRVAIVAVAAAVALAGSVSAAAYVRGLRVRTDVGSGNYGEYSYNVGAEVTVSGSNEGAPELLGFRPNWLPEIGGEFSTTVSQLDEAAMQAVLFRDVGCENEDAWNTYESMDEAERREQLANYGLGADKLDGAYSYICSVGDDCAYNITVRCLAGFDARQYILEEKTEVVKESVFNDMSATYMTVEISETDDRFEAMNILMLVDEKDNAFITISGTGDFAELEKIAANLEIIRTGLPDVWDDGSSYGGILTGFGMG